MFQGDHPAVGRAMNRACALAREFGHARVGSEHLLLALTEGPGGEHLRLALAEGARPGPGGAGEHSLLGLAEGPPSELAGGWPSGLAEGGPSGLTEGRPSELTEGSPPGLGDASPPRRRVPAAAAQPAVAGRTAGRVPIPVS
ncbi:MULTISPECIES: Clp protease N-terminal domain-containing protein [unclassified Amycolatopsis]|uniref:Clp protease N-terminal domain-containing protein n=1 Tax=unclassified Amycolatopsis TaxID=2618356 RepID=UPI00287BC556|nr:MULTISPECIES: Clp protease N-terminal domain-containing protein [unclassified Amycolatopsis]